MKERIKAQKKHNKRIQQRKYTIIRRRNEDNKIGEDYKKELK